MPKPKPPRRRQPKAPPPREPYQASPLALQAVESIRRRFSGLTRAERAEILRRLAAEKRIHRSAAYRFARGDSTLFADAFLDMCDALGLPVSQFVLQGGVIDVGTELAAAARRHLERASQEQLKAMRQLIDEQLIED